MTFWGRWHDEDEMRIRGDDNKMQGCVWIDKDMDVGYHYVEDCK